MTDTRRSLPLYALPAVPLESLGLPLYVYLPAHYAEFSGIGLAAVGVVLLLARLIDPVTDPLVGLLAGRSRHRFSPQWLMAIEVNGQRLELQAQARACYLGFVELYDVDYFRGTAGPASCVRLS